MSVPDDLSGGQVFAGTLSEGGREIAISATIHVDAAGEIVFVFDRIRLTDASQFVRSAFDEQRTRLVPFRFEGTAPDRTRFHADDLHLRRCACSGDESGVWLDIAGSCLAGVFRRRLSAPTPLPVVRLHLRGFQNFPAHQVTCRLGTVTIEGDSSNPDFRTLSGVISIHATDVPMDIAAWRAESDRLAEHIRRVMSLAAGAHLRTPIKEFFAGDDVEVTVWSQTIQSSTPIPAIRFLDQGNIFDAAVRSFFDPPIPVRHLYFAIEWFGMEGTYNEMRLVCAMTALESLANANLEASEMLIEAPKAFAKTRRVLRTVIRTCLAKWAPERTDKVLPELDEKLADLNRRSLFRKLKMLGERWGVPLDGIADDDLRAAIDARNRVIHRGEYYEDRKDDDADLWTHVTVLREVAVRFLFTAIGYKGTYISYVGHAHEVTFPPGPLGSK